MNVATYREALLQKRQELEQTAGALNSGVETAFAGHAMKGATT